MTENYDKIIRYVLGSIKIPVYIRDEAESFLNCEYVKYAMRYKTEKNVSFFTYEVKNLRPALINFLEREKMRGIPVGHKKKKKKQVYDLENIIIQNHNDEITLCELINDLFDAAEKMDGCEKNILILILLGFKKKEIAKLLKLSYSVVCKKVQEIRREARKIIKK